MPKRKPEDGGSAGGEGKVVRTGKPGRPRKAAVASVPPTVTKPNKRRTAATAELENLVREKRRQLATGTEAVDPLPEVERTLADVERRLAECRGVEQILKAKTLRRQRDQLVQRRDELRAQAKGPNDRDREMFEYLALIERMEKADVGSHRPGSGGGAKVIPTYTHLHPPKASQKNLLETMSARDAAKWQNLRAHKKRYALLYNKEHPKARCNAIDTCPECQVDLVVDRELATSVCPNCGWTRNFASHIFESKEMEKDDSGHRQQSLNHMQKFSSQFERGQASSTPEVLEALSTAYSKVHLHDPSKVQACRTGTLLKGLPEVPKAARRLPDRLTKELKGEGLPEFSSAQIQQLLQQRNRLRVPDDMAAEALVMDAASSAALSDEGGGGGGTVAAQKKSRKSFNNQIFMRQLGRSSGMEPARIFPNPKTTRIHIERTRALEKECLQLGVVTTPAPGAAPSPWALYPAS